MAALERSNTALERSNICWSDPTRVVNAERIDG